MARLLLSLLPVSTIEAAVISFNERAPQSTIARRR